MHRKAWLLAAAALVTGAVQATCYSIYKADGTLLQESSTSPVDLTLQIGDTVPAKFGAGATMTISELGFYCRDRSAEVGTGNSLAEAVRAEQQKAMLVKGPEVKVEAAEAVAVKAAPAKVTEPAKTTVAKEDGSKAVVVKEDGTKTVVETREGTVLKVKGKKKEAL
jgi:hypothetical protein